jgi:putative endonuclease
MMRSFHVYILANLERTLYIGITGDIRRRFEQHVSRLGGAFTSRHQLWRLVYVEGTGRAIDAIRREKELKGWTRQRKLRLIESANPDWRNWAVEWGWCREREDGEVLPLGSDFPPSP